jgi:hypothetical protein
LIRDAGPDPAELLAEGIDLSERAIRLAASTANCVSDFQRILDGLNGAGVRYVLIGAIALIPRDAIAEQPWARG